MGSTATSPKVGRPVLLAAELEIDTYIVVTDVFCYNKCIIVVSD